MILSDWLSKNWIEIFGAVTGIIYVFLEIKQNLWLWPVGITTSAVYILIFYTSKFYADMSLQGYYLVISCLGWYWWMRKKSVSGRKKSESESDSERKHRSAGGERREERDEEKDGDLKVTRLGLRKGMVLAGVFIILYFVMWLVLSNFTDSPVPQWDSFVTSLSIVATWMLARKIYEHWFLWIVVNTTSSILFTVRGLYPTVVLYLVYLVMSFEGLREWKRSLA